MYYGVLVTSFLSIFLGFIWSLLYSDLHESFNQIIIFYSIGTILESLAEPFLVKIVLDFNYPKIA